LILLVVSLTMIATPAVAQASVQPELSGNSFAAEVEADGAGTGSDRIAGETVNLHVSGGGGDATFSFAVTGDGRIEELERGARDDATVSLATDRATFKAIAHAPNPEQQFRTALEDGDVSARRDDVQENEEWDVFGDAEELARSLGL
jgi:hypothetical protein